MKVLLTAINSQYIHSNLAVRYLKAFTKDLNYEAKIREFTINEREELVLEEIINEKPDVVAFSTYIWNVEMVKRLSKLIKIVDENIEIIYGGPEVSYDSVDCLENSDCDYVIEGEGEKTYREFVLYKLGKKTREEIKGLHYKINNKVYSNEKRQLMDMDEIVFPYEKDEDLNNKIVYYEGSRGCPFNCKYCLSSTTHGVRFHNIERVKKELQYFIDKKVKLVKFVDRTFNCNHKYSMAIWKFLIDSNTKTRFHFEISADILRDDEIELLKTAPKDLFQFEVGVQTTNNQVLNNINRFVNFEDIKEKVEELEKIKNIKQHLDLIAGLPGEDYNSFVKSFNDLHSIRPEEIQLGFLKLLKGSDMRKECEKYGIKFSPFPPYEVLKTNKISFFELKTLKKVETLVDKYYNSQKFNNILKFFYSKFEEPYEFYYKLSLFFDSKGYFNRNIGNSEYYKVFLDFNMEILRGNEYYLKDIIKYDYLLFNKSRGLPMFLKGGVNEGREKLIKENLRGEISFRDSFLIGFSIDMDAFDTKDEIVEKDTFYILNSNNEFKRLGYEENLLKG